MLDKVFRDVSVMFKGHLEAWHKQYLYFSSISSGLNFVLVGPICTLEIDLFKYVLIHVFIMLLLTVFMSITLFITIVALTFIK